MLTNGRRITSFQHTRYPDSGATESYALLARTHVRTLVWQVFKTLGSAGFLGPTRPVEYGGLGLDYSYSIAIGEELGNIKCAGVPMAIGVQTG